MFDEADLMERQMKKTCAQFVHFCKTVLTATFTVFHERRTLLYTILIASTRFSTVSSSQLSFFPLWVTLFPRFRFG